LDKLAATEVEARTMQMVEALTADAKLARLPLIRLKVEYSGFDTISQQRFGQQFVGKVANPNDILLFYRKKASAAHKYVHSHGLFIMW
jgi:hypothetical protein